MERVQRRCVFYVAGFDPAGATRYHALYAEEAAQQARLGDIALQVGPRRRGPSRDSFWDIEAVEEGHAVRTRYEFLHWDGVVRAHWTTSRWRLLSELVWASLVVASSGALRTMWRANRVAAGVVMMPFLLLCALALLTPLLAVAVAALLLFATDSAVASVLAACAVAALLVAVVVRRTTAYSADWIARSLAFTVRQSRGQVPALAHLLDRHAGKVAQRLLEGGDDEVLVVGHSSGSILAVSIVARVLQQLATRGAVRPTFSLLTLGQCIPVLGALPDAEVFRQELLAVGTSCRVTWVDFSAPPDACCFPLVDPLAACGVRPADGATGPRLLSPRFFQMFDADEYARRRRDKFTLHFQYLRAAHRRVAYDYFSITAGARTLAARYAGAAGAAT